MKHNLFSLTTATESSLFQAAHQGDQIALGRLFEQCRPYLLSIANVHLDMQLHSKVAPSDVVQDTFLEAYRLFDRFKGLDSTELRAWLRAILLNKIADLHNRFLSCQKRCPEREQSLDESGEHGALRDVLPSRTDTPSSDISLREQTDKLTKALQQLPEEYRLVIVWRNWDQIPFAEVGQRLNRTEGAARMLYGRAIERLQQELQQSGLDK